MADKNKNRTMGALAPQKNQIFSITTPVQEKRLQLANNAPPQQIRQETARARVRAD